ncbi:3,4-dihydroxy-2-butanone 4-phosphate synthase [Fomitopsis serialis]|uniref:3,4-dihydroxy-2-butanone 4-phosphate synthase n=1 Tax=Fomitopsis serialis TaxID=139415 RepID=UPI0020089D33|nr:3,4-dihydroxy-2-butanone 4-phosphate synthase [Neoantrodia serialis]KAH9931881.1 3,4-dihydroxy-2-butanone 4-phosphate synthase [Neoantrodia serialis]
MAPVATSPESSSASLRTLKQSPPILNDPASMEGNSHPAPKPPKSSARPQAVDAPARTEFAFDDIKGALEAFGRGEFVVVMDDEGRENEGDLIIAASEVSTEKMAWMIKHTSGYICIALPGERLDELGIPMMVSENEDPHRTAYTVTVDYRHGTQSPTTPKSTHRIRFANKPPALHFSRPGHMVPLRARPGGVLTRRGHTETGVDLCAITGLPQAGVLCELVEDDELGSMMRRDGCRRFADRWGLKMISVDMLAEWRRAT